MSVETIERVDSVIGEVVLRVRHTARGAVHELIANGAFLMDSAETRSERALGALVDAGHRSVLVGGMGMGFTLRAVLDRVHADTRVDVVELDPVIARWARTHLAHLNEHAADDPRVRVRIADVAAHLAQSAGRYDAVLLDVDNGPGFLAQEENAALYDAPGLERALAALSDGGLLAIWSSHEAPALEASLRARASVEVLRVEVTRDGRTFAYPIYLARRISGTTRHRA